MFEIQERRKIKGHIYRLLLVTKISLTLLCGLLSAFFSYVRGFQIIFLPLIFLNHLLAIHTDVREDRALGLDSWRRQGKPTFSMF